jgi:hypothetical protein
MAALAKHQVIIVCGETGSGKTTQLPKIALAMGRGGCNAQGAGRRAGQGPADRPHAAAPHCRQLGGQAHRRGASHAAGRGGGLQGALPGPAEPRCLGQADDRRHPAGRDADRPAAQGLRHDHHRRGPRAQPEHRLPAGLPAPDPAAPARPESDRDLGHDRCRPLREALRVACRAGAGHHGVGPHVSGGAALAAVRGKPRLRPERGDCRRRGRTLGRRRRRRHPRLPARRARNPRSCRPPARPPVAFAAEQGGRSAASVCAPVAGRAGPYLRRPQWPAHRAGHQRGRDFADGAGHPLCDRCRHGARQALQLPQQGGAAAGRADQPGGGQPARRALRACGQRHLHPPVRREGLRRPAALHRPGNPALLAGGCHPAHEVAAPGRGGGLPVPRCALGPGHRRRLPAAQRAGRGG